MKDTPSPRPGDRRAKRSSSRHQGARYARRASARGSAGAVGGRRDALDLAGRAGHGPGDIVADATRGRREVIDGRGHPRACLLVLFGGAQSQRPRRFRQPLTECRREAWAEPQHGAPANHRAHRQSRHEAATSRLQSRSAPDLVVHTGTLIRAASSGVCPIAHCTLACALARHSCPKRNRPKPPWCVTVIGSRTISVTRDHPDGIRCPRGSRNVAPAGRPVRPSTHST